MGRRFKHHEDRLVQGESYDGDLGRGFAWDAGVFRYCEFRNLRIDGSDFSSDLLACRFESCHWYWTLFNSITLVGTTFTDCRFDRAAFAGCCFVECRFERCTFGPDALGKPCSFDDVRWHRCTQVDCLGLEEQFRARPRR